MIQVKLYTSGGTKTTFLFEEDQESPDFKKANQKHIFHGKVSELVYLEEEDRFLLGLGKKEEFSPEKLRLASFQLSKVMKKHRIQEVEFDKPDFSICHKKTMLAICEGFYQNEYHFTKKTSRKEENKDTTIHYTPAKEGKEDVLQDALDKQKGLMEAYFFARDLVNETSNIIYPESLAKKVVDHLAPIGVEVTIYDEKQIEEMGMKAYLAVAKGSDKPPRLIIMKYTGDPSEKEYFGLVGKGLTYDSGGYSLKPSSSMVTMHSDMGGAGAVIGTMYALAKNKAKANVIAVVAACENLVSGKAYKTGDIISSLSGKTIEVLNTDAEGRLTLADAVYYITHELGVSKLIDLATLTGAALVALGEEYSAAVTNDEAFYKEIEAASKEAGDKIWLLPNDEVFRKMNESKVADLLNSPGRLAGTVTAGLFVGEFVKESTPWIHLDIAGTAYIDKANGYLPARATGAPIRTLYKYLAKEASC